MEGIGGASAVSAQILRHHRLLGTEELALGSLGLTEARDNRFSVLDIPDAAGCHRRAENKVGTLGVALSALGCLREKGQREREQEQGICQLFSWVLNFGVWYGFAVGFSEFFMHFAY